MKRRNFLKTVLVAAASAVLPKSNIAPAEGGYVTDPPPLAEPSGGFLIDKRSPWIAKGDEHTLDAPSWGIPGLVHYEGDSQERFFSFPASRPPLSLGRVEVWVDGQRQTFFKTWHGVELITPPAEGAAVVVFYEYAA